MTCLMELMYGGGHGRTRIVKMGKNSGILNGSTFQYWIARLSSRRPSLAFAGLSQGGLFPLYKRFISTQVFGE